MVFEGQLHSTESAGHQALNVLSERIAADRDAMKRKWGDEEAEQR